MGIGLIGTDVGAGRSRARTEAALIGPEILRVRSGTDSRTPGLQRDGLRRAAVILESVGVQRRIDTNQISRSGKCAIDRCGLEKRVSRGDGAE